MDFIKYPKIYRLGGEETDGILSGQCFVQEKIDGANTSIWLDDGVVQTGSRNRVVTDKSFNGLTPYAQGHVGIQKLLMANPDYRLYGEWLVRHTIQYNETAYKKFYLFDIKHGDNFLTTDEVYSVANEYRVDTPHLFGLFDNPSVDMLKEFVGESTIGENGEGIVIKNFNFINKFCELTYAKIVTGKFKEDNAIVFGGNNKHSESYWEMYVINKYMTLPRLRKVLNKLQPEMDEVFDMKHIPRITNTAYHDMITEEIWEIQKRAKSLDFKKLKSLAMKKAKQIYVDILNNDISVVDE